MSPLAARQRHHGGRIHRCMARRQQRRTARPLPRQRLRRALARPQPVVDQRRAKRDGSAWTFTDMSIESGAGLYMNTMGIGIGDLDRDGDFDLALTNIGGNKLLRSNGDGTFVERRSRVSNGRCRASTTSPSRGHRRSTTSISTVGTTSSWRPATWSRAPTPGRARSPTWCSSTTAPASASSTSAR